MRIPVDAASSQRLSAAYWRQWIASAISNMGDGVNAAALPLLAYSLTRDSRLIAGVSVVMTLPWFVLALPVGVVVDRYNRQTLMVSTNVIRGALFAGLTITAATGTLHIWLLYLLLLGVGICEVIFDSSAQAFLPALVEPSQLPKANGRLYMAETVANFFLGQPFGAVLFALAIGLPFGINSASFLVAAVLVASIRLKPGTLPTPNKAAGETKSFRSEIGESVRWLWNHRLLRTMAVMLGAANLGGILGVSIFVQFALQTLHVNARWYGALLALMALGAILGGLIGDRLVKRLGRSLSMRVSFIVFGVAAIGMGLSPNYWYVAAFSFVEALATIVWNIVSVSLRQQIIPGELFGRINSVYRWLGTGSTAVGALIGGQLAYHFNLRTPFVVGGAVILVAFAAMGRRLSDERINDALAGTGHSVPHA
jgi:MFS family permease